MSGPLLNIFRTRQADPERYVRGFDNVPVSTGLIARTRFSEGWNNAIVAPINRLLETQERGDPSVSPLISPAEAKTRFDYETTDWLTEAQVEFLARNRSKEIGRAGIIARQRGFWQGAAGFGAEMAGFSVDPGIFATLLIPGVGSTRYMKALGFFSRGRAATAIQRQIARSSLYEIDRKATLAAMERLGIRQHPFNPIKVPNIRRLEMMAGARAKILARATTQGASAAMQQTAVEPLVWWLRTQEGKDYSTGEAYANILFAGILGSALSVGLGAASDVLGPRLAPQTHSRLVQEARMAMEEDRVPNWNLIRELDPIALEQKAKMDPDIMNAFPDVRASAADTSQIMVGDKIEFDAPSIGPSGASKRMLGDVTEVLTDPTTGEPAYKVSTASPTNVPGKRAELGVSQSNFPRKITPGGVSPERMSQYKDAVRAKADQYKNQTLQRFKDEDLVRDTVASQKHELPYEPRNKPVTQESGQLDDMTDFEGLAAEIGEDVEPLLDDVDRQAIADLQTKIDQTEDWQKGIQAGVNCFIGNA